MINCWLIGVATVSIVTAQAEPAAIVTNAARALDQVPEVAVADLQELLKQNLPDNQWRAAAEKLAEAYVRANRSEDALRLSEDSRLRDDLTAKFWRAQALAGLGRAADALLLYQQVANVGSALVVEAQFGEAEMLRALGRTDEAIAKYSNLFRDPNFGMRAQLRAIALYLDKSDSTNAGRLLNKVRPSTAEERKERHFLRGRLELAAHWPEKAIATFESILTRPRGATHSVVLASLFGIADAHLQLHAPEKGDDILEDFIEHHPQDADLDRIFAKLDELYRAERRPGRGELERWVRDPAEPRRAFAQWYLAQLELRAGHKDRALQLFESLQEQGKMSPALAPALIQFAQLQSQDRQFDKALATLDQARSLQPPRELLDQIDFQSAEIQYRAKHFDAAATTFERVANSSTVLRDVSNYDAALGWLQAGRRDQFAAISREVIEKEGEQGSSADLQLDAGLVQAANGDKQAESSLLNFVRAFPQHERVGEAWVALAELAFHASPPQLDNAQRYLAAATHPSPPAEERRDYLGIWIEDATGGNEEQVIVLAKRFLQNHPNSKSTQEVRLKLAEVYYREQDFPNAQTEFELLAEQTPDSSLSEKAVFFAAESAMSSMGTHALEQSLTLFDRVVRMNGELKWTARNEQAAIERKLDKPSDAIVLYDEVLKGDARAAEKREALCGKADVFFEMGSSDPKNFQRALELYNQLAADREGATHWRRQALFKKGLCFEKETNPDQALAAFYDVLEGETGPNEGTELFWFYKAGFSAGQLLEEQAKWQSAAAIYQKLVAAGGARSDEAKQRLDRVRLEHFLWEE